MGRAMVMETLGGNVSHSYPPSTSRPPPSSLSSCDPQVRNCRWWPYSTSNDFEANTGIIIILLLCALICALALNTAIRWFLRGGSNNTSQERRLSRTQQQLSGQEKPDTETVRTATLLVETLTYSAGMKLGGTESDCAICLSEFVHGDRVQVLGRCKHGFHSLCVDRWLSCHSSCPTCRCSCIASSSASLESPKAADCCAGNGVNGNSQRAEQERAPEHHIASPVPPDLPV